MFAGKQFDIVQGVDIHLFQAFAPGPPAPVPYPFVGMVYDPGEFTPQGATILIEGIPRAQAGTVVMAVPPHIPIMGTFPKPPTSDGEIFMGSSTVVADGEPLANLGVQVLTCQDAGMPSVVRPNRKSKSKPMGLMLPVSTLVGAGGTVLVGGAPSVIAVVPEAPKGPSSLGKLKMKKSLKPV